jgi:hypothetical protein
MTNNTLEERIDDFISKHEWDICENYMNYNEASDKFKEIVVYLLDVLIADTRAEAARIGDSSDGEYEPVIDFAMRQVADRMQELRDSLSLTKTKDHE